MTKAAESVDVRPITWLPCMDMQYLVDACELKIVKKGDIISIPHTGQKFEIEIVSFKPENESAVKVRKWTEFRILKKDSQGIDHFYDPDPDEEIRKMMGVKDQRNVYRARKDK